MANKKINELDSRASLSLSDLMAVGDPSTGYLYKTTISDLKTLTGAGVISFNGRFGAVVPVEGDYSLTQLSDVIITTAANNDIIKYNGSNWVNVPMYTGTIAQYVDGTGAYQTFPTLLSSDRLITEVRNSSGATMTKGTVVYLNGSSGTLPTIAKAQANAESTSTGTYGVVQNDIANNANGYVVVIGNLTGLDTSAYTAGDILWLSPTVAGGFTTTKPVAPDNTVYVAIVTRSSNTQGTIEVKIQNGYELDELHNVLITSATNNDGLFWESATSLWKNKSISTVLGYTPQEQLNGTGFVKASGTTITYDNSTYLTTSSASSTYLTIANAASTYVPYTGATGAVNLGAFDLTVNAITVGKGAGNISTNTAIGYQALAANTTGYSNVAIGWRSLYANTIANNNTSIGESAMIALTTGDNNTGVGNYVLNGLTTGTMNTALGKSAGQSITTGTYNTIIGGNNTTGITTGSYNTIIGGFISGLSSTLSNNIIISDGQGNIRYRWDGANNNFYQKVIFGSTIGNGTYTYTLPSATGTIALTSNLSAYLPLAGGTMTGNLFLRSNNTVGGTNYYIGQTMGDTDSWKIYGNSVASDQGELVFELNDNALSWSSLGERFRFFFNASYTGVSKNGLILDYDTATFNTAATFTGNVSIGTTSANARLDISGQDIYLTGYSDNRIRFSNFGFTGNNMGAAIGYVYSVANTQESGSLAFYTNPNFNGTGSLTEQVRIVSNGNINFNATVYNNTAVATTRTLYIGSDYRIGGISSVRASKKNIENISSVDWIYQLNPVTFNYRKKDENEQYTDEVYEELVYGLIAEDTQPIADLLINYNDKKEMIGIEYSRLITPMLKVIQEHKAEIESLKAKLN